MYKNITKIVETSLDVKCIKNNYTFNDPFLPGAKKLLKELYIITDNKIIKNKDLYIFYFNKNLIDFNESLNVFDEKLKKLINNFVDLNNQEIDVMSYLLEIYSTHNMWKKRITYTLSSIDNNFSIMVPKENNEIVIFSNDCVGKMLLNKMDFFEKYYPISSEYNFIDWIMLSVNCELKDITKLSIYDLGNDMMTYKMILHELTGVKSKSPRKNQIDDIKNSIEKNEPNRYYSLFE